MTHAGMQIWIWYKLRQLLVFQIIYSLVESSGAGGGVGGVGGGTLDLAWL